MWRAWLDNPIFVKHARSRLRTQSLATSAAVTLMICLCILYGSYQTMAFAGGGGFSALLALQFIVLGIMGSTQVGASVGSARSSGILDFHRVSPQSPLELSLGFLFGAPIREYLLAALVVPFMLGCVMMGHPDFRGFLQLEILLVATALTLHAMSLLGGLAMKGTMSGQSALGFTVVIGIFVIGPLFGIFQLISQLVLRDVHLDLFTVPLPWLAFVMLHLAAVFALFMVASTRKMESDRQHCLTKPQALAAVTTTGVLAVGGMSNWAGEPAFHMIVVYVMTALAIILIGLCTPSLPEFDKGLRRARKQGLASVPAWTDFAPNRPVVFAICTVLLVAGSVVGAFMSDQPGRTGEPTRAGFPLTVATAVMVTAYYGLSLQYFLLRFGRRAGNFFGLFLFTAWATPLVLGVMSLATFGPNRNQAEVSTIFAATPIVGIAAASGIFQNEAGSGPALIAITLAIFFAFLFNMLYTKAVRRVKASLDASDPVKAMDEADLIEAAPAPAPAS